MIEKELVAPPAGAGKEPPASPEFLAGCTEPDFVTWWDRFGATLQRDDRITVEMLALAAFSAGKSRREE